MAHDLLAPLVPMVLQEPSRVDLLAALSEGEGLWEPLVAAGTSGAGSSYTGRAPPAAETLGYVVPETLCVQAGQLFYHNGRLEEVRLAGVCSQARPTSTSGGRPRGVPLRPRACRQGRTPSSDSTLPRPVAHTSLHSSLRTREHRMAFWSPVPGRSERLYVMGPLASRCPPCSRSSPSSPAAFPNERGTIPANPLITAGMAALWKGGAKARHLQGVAGERDRTACLPA